jgi:hypothetical protein
MVKTLLAGIKLLIEGNSGSDPSLHFNHIRSSSPVVNAGLFYSEGFTTVVMAS